MTGTARLLLLGLLVALGACSTYGRPHGAYPRAEFIGVEPIAAQYQSSPLFYGFQGGQPQVWFEREEPNLYRIVTAGGEVLGWAVFEAEGLVLIVDRDGVTRNLLRSDEQGRYLIYTVDNVYLGIMAFDDRGGYAVSGYGDHHYGHVYAPVGWSYQTGYYGSWWDRNWRYGSWIYPSFYYYGQHYYPRYRYRNRHDHHDDDRDHDRDDRTATADTHVDGRLRDSDSARVRGPGGRQIRGGRTRFRPDGERSLTAETDRSATGQLAIGQSPDSLATPSLATGGTAVPAPRPYIESAPATRYRYRRVDERTDHQGRPKRSTDTVADQQPAASAATRLDSQALMNARQKIQNRGSRVPGNGRMRIQPHENARARAAEPSAPRLTSPARNTAVPAPRRFQEPTSVPLAGARSPVANAPRPTYSSPQTTTSAPVASTPSPSRQSARPPARRSQSGTRSSRPRNNRPSKPATDD